MKQVISLIIVGIFVSIQAVANAGQNGVARSKKITSVNLHRMNAQAAGLAAQIPLDLFDGKNIQLNLNHVESRNQKNFTWKSILR